MVVITGLTEVLAPVAPFDHNTVPVQPVAVSITLPPVQITVDGLAEMTGAASGATVIVYNADDALLQPFTLQTAE